MEFHAGSLFLPRLAAVGFIFFLATGLFVPARGEQSDEGVLQQQEEELKRRNVAVALNFCRASFHRIGKYPTPEVMEEEQQ